MEFFDRKQEVMDVQLTQYGKHLLSIGRFKPEFYSFFDHDILYDGNWGYTGSHVKSYEDQNDIEPRIKEETPRPKVQHNYLGSENSPFFTAIQQAIPSFEMDKQVLGPSVEDMGNLSEFKGALESAGAYLSPETNYSLGGPLGHSSLSNRFSPAWSIKYLHNNLTGAVEHLSGSRFGSFRIPQLSSSIEFKTFVSFYDVDGELIKDYVENDYNYYTSMDVGAEQYQDGSTIQIQPDYLFVEVEEENTDFFKENFDIEVIKFWHETQTGNNDTENENQKVLYEKRLFFKRDNEELLPHHVEYYFDLLVDEEIDSIFYCEAENVTKQTEKSVFADQTIPFNCPDKQQVSSDNIYETSVTDQDFKDPC